MTFNTFNINKVAVLGSGTLGAGIAARLVGTGIPVCLLDIAPTELTEAEEKAGLSLASEQVRNRLALASKERLLKPASQAIYDASLGSMIQVGNLTDDLNLLEEVDWIIEVVVETLEGKRHLFQRVNQYRRPGTIISTNTSYDSINEMVKGLPLEFRQHFLGTHFFNPFCWMKPLEIIPFKGCLPELVDFMIKFGEERLGEGIVMAKDTPNFIAHRIGVYCHVLIINTMLQYGFNIAQADEVIGTLMGRPRDATTFRTIDMVGLDIFSHVVGKVIAGIDDAEEKREFKIPNIVFELIDKGFLGDKTGQGFYKNVKTKSRTQTLCWDYQTGKYVTPERGELPSVAAYWDYDICKYVVVERRELPTVAAAKKARNLKGKLRIMVYGTEMDSEFAWEITKKWLIYTARKVSEISDDYKAIDRAMRWGFNFDIGPFAFWDAIGLVKSVARMREEGEVIPKWIEDRLAKGQYKFYETDTEKAPSILLALR